MAKKSRCCVSNCDKLELRTHRFPIYYEEVYNIWLERIGRMKLFEMDPITVNRNYVICDKHFSEECKIPGSKKLKLYSLPTLQLPESAERHVEYTMFALPSSTGTSSNIDNSTSRLEDVAAVEVVNVMDIPPVAEVLSTPATDILSTPSKKRQRTTSRSSSTGGKSRKHLLRDINVKKKIDLTPRKAYLYQAAVKLREQRGRLEKRCLSFKQRLGAAESFSESEFYRTLMESVDKITYRFIMCQLRNKKLKPKGRRYTTEDKVMALALYKQSGKGYRLLSKMFALPSRKTMMSLLTRIPFNTGINKRIFANLKKSTSNLTPRERYCVLMFDEMSLGAHLQYNAANDVIVGFEDMGGESRKAEFADHALVFMVQGISKKYKQPVAYYFTRSEMNSINLVRIIKQVVRAVRNAGLKIVATVCDQAQTNMAAINYLKKETKATYLRKNEEFTGLGYELEGEEIFHLYDSPHLLKGMRNNLLTKDVTFTQNNIKKTAKWSHIIDLYNLDKNVVHDFKLLPKLTDYHVVKDKIKKMKVAYAAQVMSQRVSCIMRRLAEFSEKETDPAKQHLDPAASDTADFLLLVDKLFDSVNGSSILFKNGKILRVAITKKSPHAQFWNEALQILETVRFVCPKTQKPKQIPTVKNWISNLKCFKALSEKLFAVGFKFINIRAFNQDPLENYFGQIRSHGVRHTNPTATSFKASFKALLLNNFVSSHSMGANCEEDESEGALNNLQFFITEDVPNEQEMSQPIVQEEDETEIPETNISDAAVYVVGYVARKILKKVNKCKVCKTQLVRSRDPGSIISAREYIPDVLNHPTDDLAQVLEKIKFLFYQNIEKCAQNRDVSKFILMCSMKIKHNFHCDIHNLFEEVTEFFVRFLLFQYTKSINQILHGKITNIASSDILKTKASNYFKKRDANRRKNANENKT